MRKFFLNNYDGLHFEKSEAPELTYTATIDTYNIEDARACIKITTDRLCEQTIKEIDSILSQLEKMHNAAKQAYLNDFNDEEENTYITNIYKKFLRETEFEFLKQSTDAEQRLLLGINLTSIEINIRKGNTSAIFTYIKGYELVHKYKFDKDYEHPELIFQASPCIMKEQLSTFIDMRELPVINEVCGRFRKDWQNYPVKSYFIYLMARSIKNYLKDFNTLKV